MTYEAWRISYQSSEQAARAAYAECARLQAKVEAMERQEPAYWGPKHAIEGGSTTLLVGKFPVNPTDVPLYALHGAQPAPSVPEVTDAMALAFHAALTDGSIGESEVEEIKKGLRAALSAATEAKP